MSPQPDPGRRPWRGGAVILGCVFISVWFAVYQGQAAAALAEALNDSKQQSAILMFERGLGLCEQHDEAEGLVWLARSLRYLPEDKPAMRRVIRCNLSNWLRASTPCAARFPLPSFPTCVAFRPDGKGFVTGHEDGSLRLWETDGGKPVGPGACGISSSRTMMRCCAGL